MVPLLTKNLLYQHTVHSENCKVHSRLRSDLAWQQDFKNPSAKHNNRKSSLLIGNDPWKIVSSKYVHFFRFRFSPSFLRNNYGYCFIIW